MKKIQKGFTLIELMIVVAIIGILAAVAIPAYQDYVTKAKLAKVTSTLAPLKLALSTYSQEIGSFPLNTGGITAVTSTTTPVAVTANTVWASIGLKYEPTVPPELASVQYIADAADPQAVRLRMTFVAAGVATGVNGLILTQKVLIGGTGVIWVCESGANTTITSAIALKYFGC